MTNYHYHPRSQAPLTRTQAKAIPPFEPNGEGRAGALRAMRERLAEAGVWNENQALGLRYPVGCVALEITQRCNLDCTLCYLSEYSEAVKDIPMEEIYRRIDEIYEHYGPGTDVQITGGDPTLRNYEELKAIIRRVRDRGMQTSLFTNGIIATRRFLKGLSEAGLTDVAFHVDTTQERKGFATEADLNRVREQYIERAKGLPIHVIFNTTIHDGNFHEIPELVRFFRKHSDVVQFVSFQLQADTGRGVMRQREPLVSVESVREQIMAGAGTPLTFGSIQVGHSDCNQTAAAFSVNGNLYDLYSDKKLIADLLRESVGVKLDRRTPVKTALRMIRWSVKNPGLLIRASGLFLPKLWRMKADLLKSKGRLGKLTFFIHNFMDASRLQCDRIHACSFMIMTHKGPISMCLHNARRDEFILQPLKARQSRFWNPISGRVGEPELVQIEKLESNPQRQKKLHREQHVAHLQRQRENRESQHVSPSMG